MQSDPSKPFRLLINIPHPLLINIPYERAYLLGTLSTVWGLGEFLLGERDYIVVAALPSVALLMANGSSWTN